VKFAKWNQNTQPVEFEGEQSAVKEKTIRQSFAMLVSRLEMIFPDFDLVLRSSGNENVGAYIQRGSCDSQYPFRSKPFTAVSIAFDCLDLSVSECDQDILTPTSSSDSEWQMLLLRHQQLGQKLSQMRQMETKNQVLFVALTSAHFIKRLSTVWNWANFHRPL
jgi:hypothetical protein